MWYLFETFRSVSTVIAKEAVEIIIVPCITILGRGLLALTFSKEGSVILPILDKRLRRERKGNRFIGRGL